jgi:hypothetical protein
MRIALLVSLLASSTLTFAQTTPEEMAFKDAFIKAAKANDTVAIMALTCLDGVTPEWKTMLEGSYKHIFPQFQEQEPETVTFTPFSGPQPEPIKYKDIFLITAVQNNSFLDNGH